MGIFDFLRKKTNIPTSSSGPAYTFGSGAGLTVESAVEVIPVRLEELRCIFRETIGNDLPSEMTTSRALDGLIAEMCKMQWITKEFGDADIKGWKLGARMYLADAKQGQELLFLNGRAITLFFDFKAFHPLGWQDGV